MEGVLPAIEHLGHRQLYGNLTLDKLKSNWKEKRGSGGLTVNISEGCWRHSGESVVCRTMKRCLQMCCERVEGNVTYPRQIQGKVLHFSLTGCLQYFQVFNTGAVYRSCSLFQCRCEPWLTRGGGAMAWGLCMTPENPLLLWFSALSSRQLLPYTLQCRMGDNLISHRYRVGGTIMLIHQLYPNPSDPPNPGGQFLSVFQAAW